MPSYIFAKDTPQEWLTSVKIDLLKEYPFFGYLALGLKLEEDKNVPTLATDGERIGYNPEFIQGTRNKHGADMAAKLYRTYVMHEVIHCVLGHLWRREKRDKEKWNIAADHASNLLLKKHGFLIPSWACCDEQYDGLTAEIIYLKLPDGKQQGKLLDSHDNWPGSSSTGNNASNPLPQDGSDRNNSKQNEAEDPSGKEKEADDGVKAGEEDFPGERRPTDLEKEWKDKLARAATFARMRGNLPGNMGGLIQDVLEPKLDWRMILRELVMMSVKNNFRLVPPAKKHIWRDVYLPSLYGESIEIAVGVDTSGSISLREFQEFIAELRGITEQFEDYVLHLFFCDAALHDEMILTSQDEWPEKFPKKSGGTDFRPVFNRIDELMLPVTVLVYLTDGDGTYPVVPPPYPVIWVLNKDYAIPWGEKVEMEVEHG